jgi:hypothetical protein
VPAGGTRPRVVREAASAWRAAGVQAAHRAPAKRVEELALREGLEGALDVREHDAIMPPRRAATPGYVASPLNLSENPILAVVVALGRTRSTDRVNRPRHAISTNPPMAQPGSPDEFAGVRYQAVLQGAWRQGLIGSTSAKTKPSRSTTSPLAIGIGASNIGPAWAKE